MPRETLNYYKEQKEEAWSSGNITNHHAAQYMGMKNIKHLDDIRKEYFK